MNEILDMLVGNDFIFFGLLIFLGITLLILIFSVTKKSKKHRKIPIYEEDLEDKELKDVKAENVIDKPEVKKKASKQKKEESVEEEEVVTVASKEEEDDLVEETKTEENHDRLEELEQIDEEEIKERIIKEHEEDIEEAIEEFDDDEMTGLLQNLKEAKEVKPEDVVRQFEQEQEAQSIISYQELVDVVKNRDNQFEDELESKPLATVSDFLPETNSKETGEQDQEMMALIEQLEKPKEENVEEVLTVSNEDIEVLEPSEEEIEVLQANHDDQVEKERIESTKAMVREALKDIPTDGKFKKTELISPVFGRIKEEQEDSYPTVPKFSREKEEDLIEELELPMVEKSDSITGEATKGNLFEDISDTVEEENAQIFEEIPVAEEKEETLFEEIPATVEEKEDLGIGDISKNEDFLKALKDFRDSL